VPAFREREVQNGERTDQKIYLTGASSDKGNLSGLRKVLCKALLGPY